MTMTPETKAAYDTLMKIRNTSGKNDKIALLAAQKGNAFLKEYLRMTYEPRVNFYMKKVDPKFATQVYGVKMDLTALEQITRTISGRVLTGHAAREWLANMHKSFGTDEERELLELLIGRDVKAGMSGGTINKVWPDLLTDVPYMRCCLPKDTDLDKFDWRTGVFSQMKCDGMFANVTHSANGEVRIESRSGSPFPIDMFGDIVEAVKARVHPGIQLHGELLTFKDGEVAPRQIGNGMLNSVLQGGNLKDGYTVRLVVWDAIPEAEAKPKNKYKLAYAHRYEILQKMFGGLGSDAAVQVVETRVVHSIKEAGEHYKEVLLRGLEGTVMKNPTGIWEDTTSKNQVKFKMEVTVDLRVKGYNPGTGKNEALFGSLQCETSDELLEVNVTGFSDDLRAELFEDIDNLINGGIVAVKSNCLMAPSTPGGKWSLFLPRFEERRLDKKRADTLQEIKDQFEAAIAQIGE